MPGGISLTAHKLLSSAALSDERQPILLPTKWWCL